MGSFLLLKFFNDQLGSNDIKKIESCLVEDFHLVREIFDILRDIGCQNSVVSAKIDDGSVTLIMDKKEFAKEVQKSCRSYTYGKKQYEMEISRKAEVLMITAKEI